ncbi:MAG TPA: AraC family transcriptional regulator [Pyrinomonadaceae bacterium]|nr:AraC family transcriptional regulator [Pyrinomonadaceae bacterium]
MSKTLLAVGHWGECWKIISAAVANRWSVLHTLLSADIPAALGARPVSLILLAGCPGREGWEAAARDAWTLRRDTPVVALGDGPSQDSLVSALVGPEIPAESAGQVEARGDTGWSAAGAPWRGRGGGREVRRSRLTSTLTLFEPRTAGASSGIRLAVEFIESHFAEPISLDDAARVASYSRCHFSKLFREQTGLGFVACLTRVRLRRAAELLARTELPVTEVALEAGFNDLSHFERVFRAEHRRSPTAFRRLAKNLPPAPKHPPSLSPATLPS